MRCQELLRIIARLVVDGVVPLVAVANFCKNDRICDVVDDKVERCDGIAAQCSLCSIVIGASRSEFIISERIEISLTDASFDGSSDVVLNGQNQGRDGVTTQCGRGRIVVGAGFRQTFTTKIEVATVTNVSFYGFAEIILDRENECRDRVTTLCG